MFFVFVNFSLFFMDFSSIFMDVECFWGWKGRWIQQKDLGGGWQEEGSGGAPEVEKSWS